MFHFPLFHPSYLLHPTGRACHCIHTVIFNITYWYTSFSLLPRDSFKSNVSRKTIKSLLYKHLTIITSLCNHQAIVRSFVGKCTTYEPSYRKNTLYKSSGLPVKFIKIENTRSPKMSVIILTRSPLGPTGPGSPAVPFCPFMPFEPRKPGKPGVPRSPLVPLAPTSPLAPDGPVLPVDPFSPFNPSVPYCAENNRSCTTTTIKCWSLGL